MRHFWFCALHWPSNSIIVHSKQVIPYNWIARTCCFTSNTLYSGRFVANN